MEVTTQRAPPPSNPRRILDFRPGTEWRWIGGTSTSPSRWVTTSKPSPMPGRPKFPPVLFLSNQSPSALDLAAAKTRKLQRGKHHKAQHLRRRSIQAPDQRRPDLVSDESHHPAPADGDQAPDPEGSDPRPTAHATTRSSGRTTPRARTPTAGALRTSRPGSICSAAAPRKSPAPPLERPSRASLFAGRGREPRRRPCRPGFARRRYWRLRGWRRCGRVRAPAARVSPWSPTGATVPVKISK